MLRSLRRLAGGSAPEIAFRLGWTLFFLVVWTRAISSNEAGGITAGHINVWGDWAIHFTMGSAMAYRSLILHSNPLLFGSPFNYPFFVNFVSALLIRAGVPFFSAFTVPSFFFSVFFIWSLPNFFSRLLGSVRAGLFASLIFLLNGGVGFVKYLHDIVFSSDRLHTFLYPPAVYSHLVDNQVLWMNVVESMVIPQRAFQLGFPWMLTLLAVVLKEKGLTFGTASAEPGFWRTPARAAVLGLFYGFLPLVHTHAFACGGLILVSLCLWDAGQCRGALRSWFKWWGAFLAGTLVLALPILKIFLSSAMHQSVMKWSPGWYSATFKGWVWFWWINWGPALLAATLGFSWLLIRARERRLQVVLFAVPFVALFALANLFIVHSWIWDNTKYIVWSAVGVSTFSAFLLERLWSTEGRAGTLLRPVGLLSLMVICLTGAIDNYRILIPSLNSNQIYSNEDLYLADWARKNTPVDSVWLTGDDHNNWLYNLTGRQPVEAYVGWLWTHGYDYNAVNNDVETMYSHPDRDDLFQKYRVSYIVVGRAENDSLTVDQQGFDRRFPVVIRTGTNVVYRYVKPGETVVPPSAPVPEAPLPLTSTFRPGLVRRTYHGTYFFGKALIKEGVSDINFEYGRDDEKPFPVPGSVEWEGYLRIPEHREYRFSLESDDGAWLALDGVDVIDNGGSHPAQSASATIALAEGYHRFRLRYFDSGENASLKFGWTSSDQNNGGSEGLFH